MESPVPRPDVRRVLGRLKDFQRDTVDYVFGRMYEDREPATRFLVADEVGLGKTLVAGGVIARAVDHLWDQVRRIDIVYVCSNASIARQNVNRLRKLLGGYTAVLPSRITLLPSVVRDLASRRLNLVSFTPGTSFDLRSSLGTMDERALLYWLLPDTWTSLQQGAVSILTGTARRANFEGVMEHYRTHVDDSLRNDFRQALQNPEGQRLQARFVHLSEALRRRSSNLSEEEWCERSAIVGDLRGVLAASCLESLEPDLIVLDEFQRFKHLLGSDDEACKLARDLFAYRDRNTGRDVRVLLLSATPYKMYTLGDEIDGEDHFKDFIGTVEFLQHDPARTAEFRRSLEGYRRALFQFDPANESALAERKSDIERELQRVMARTERLSVKGDRNGMLVEVPATHMRLEVADLESYLAVQGVGRLLNQGETLEYWKSAPYLLNFMEEYELKRDFRKAVAGEAPPGFYEKLAACTGALLSWKDVQAYRRVDPGNARLRSLIDDLDACGAWRLFWLPSALPYYRLGSEYADVGSATLTKRLLFSSWQVVPKVVAALISYEVERRLQGVPEEGEDDSNTVEARRKRRRLLRFSRSEGRLTGMPVLGLLYPCATLARLADPLVIGARLRSTADSGFVPSADEVLQAARKEVERLLEGLGPAPGHGAEDESWYWAAPVLFDLQADAEATRRWLGQHDLKTRWREGAKVMDAADPFAGVGDGDDTADEAWGAHVDEVHALRNGRLSLGRRPDDLAQVLALSALAAPGTVALRAISRVVGGWPNGVPSEVRTAAGRVAEGFRSLFNQPDVTAYVRRTRPAETPYWKSVLDYCASGCLQAVMDEYAHAAAELIGAQGSATAANEIANEIIVALTLRTVNLGVDLVRLDEHSRQVHIDPEPRGFRARFALRFGERRGEESAAGSRQDAVRKAFNSPFWPFVLCSTSVGQEGLDFHPYCHAIVHWNLPANPVDLEQREGRIHRYKGHAVRKNLALRHGPDVLRDASDGGDPWRELFRRGLEDRTASDRELVPYWVYLAENGARIERHIPALPLSRDVERAAMLRRALVVYRMAFGQNRQEDLIAYLTARIPPAQVERVAEQLRIDLSPPRTQLAWGEDVATEALEPEIAPLEILGEDHADAALEWSPNLDDLYELLDRAAALVCSAGFSDEAERLRQLLDIAAPLLKAPPSPVPSQLRELLDQFASLRALTEP